MSCKSTKDSMMLLSKNVEVNEKNGVSRKKHFSTAFDQKLYSSALELTNLGVASNKRSIFIAKSLL